MPKTQKETWLYVRVPLGVLSAGCLFATAYAASARPLWIDEMFTYVVANLDGPAAIVTALLDKADNHPPVDYLLRHYSMRLFGPSELAFRLPSILAFWAAALCLYRFVARRAPGPAALVAAVFPIGTLALDYAYEGRGYGLLLAWMGIALLSWQMAAERRSALGPVLLAVSLGLGPFSHYYGVLNFVPIAVGEAWRSYQRRTVSWPIVGAILTALASLALLYPFMANATGFKTGFWAKFGIGTPLQHYLQLVNELALPVTAAATVVLMLAADIVTARREARPTAFTVPGHEVAAAIALCLTPFTIYVMAVLYTNAMVVRFALVTVLGAALLAAYLTHWAGARRQAFAVIIAASFLFFGGAKLAHLARQADHARPKLPEPMVSLIRASDLPVVIADGHQFLPLHHYLPEPLKGKIRFVTDIEYALAFSGNDTGDRSHANLRPYTTANIRDYCEFVTNNREFLVLNGEGRWLLPRLVEAKAAIGVRQLVGKSQPVFHVRMPPRNPCKGG